jgi:hypothetical protein
VFWPKGKPLPGNNYSYDGDYYGWDNFTLVSLDEKMRYFDAQAGSNGIGVDHQSQWVMPKVVHGNQFGFSEFLKKFIMQDNVVILGGNDNSEGHPLLQEEGVSNRKFKFLTSWNGAVARQEPYGWAIHYAGFGGDTGVIRLGTGDVMHTKSETPELVDLKLTDKCSEGCSFCYQNSSPEGKHADLTNVKNLLRGFRDYHVFEVAIGGGEPTEYPHLRTVIDYCNEIGIRCNISTRHPERMKAIGGKPSFLGVSVSSVEDMERIRSELDYTHNVVWHIIMGNQSMPELEKMMDNRSYDNILLLGWKATGRANGAPPFDYNNVWLDMAQQRDGMTSIDTCLAREVGHDALAAANVDKIFYETTEGLHSCYVDAVEMTVGRCSYAGEMTSIGGDYPTYEAMKQFKGY